MHSYPVGSTVWYSLIFAVIVLVKTAIWLHRNVAPLVARVR